MPRSPGETLDRYVIEAHLGGGAFADVYSARDTKLDRRVALKVLREGAAVADAARLVREVRAAANVVHANIVTVIDVGEIEGGPFIVMELLSGRTLRAVITDGRGPFEQALRWLSDLADALGAIHARGSSTAT
jgi:serine/threonine-protein kinase